MSRMSRKELMSEVSAKHLVFRISLRSNYTVDQHGVGPQVQPRQVNHQGSRIFLLENCFVLNFWR